MSVIYFVNNIKFILIYGKLSTINIITKCSNLKLPICVCCYQGALKVYFNFLLEIINYGFQVEEEKLFQEDAERKGSMICSKRKCVMEMCDKLLG